MFDAIYTYIPPSAQVNPMGYHAHHQETSWELFAHDYRRWLWESESGEWFYRDEPANGWRRYTWVTSFPIRASTTFSCGTMKRARVGFLNRTMEVDAECIMNESRVFNI